MVLYTGALARVDGKVKLSRFLENGKEKLSSFTAKPIMVSSQTRPRKQSAKMLSEEVWHTIRVLHFRKGRSKASLAKEFGISRNTVAKYLKDAGPPEYKRKVVHTKWVQDKWREHARLILAEDQGAPRKQHHTAKRVYDRLCIEYGYTGSERTVRELVAALRGDGASKAFIPLMFEPGKDAQVDFGEAVAEIDGEQIKLYGFEMRLNYSRRKFQMYFRSPNMESFLEAHVPSIQFFWRSSGASELRQPWAGRSICWKRQVSQTD